MSACNYAIFYIPLHVIGKDIFKHFSLLLFLEVLRLSLVAIFAPKAKYTKVYSLEI